MNAGNQGSLHGWIKRKHVREHQGFLIFIFRWKELTDPQPALYPYRPQATRRFSQFGITWKTTKPGAHGVSALPKADLLFL